MVEEPTHYYHYYVVDEQAYRAHQHADEAEDEVALGQRDGRQRDAGQ